MRRLVLSLVSLGLALAAASAATTTASTPLSPKLRGDLAALVSGDAALDARIPGLIPGLAAGEIPYFAVLSESNDALHRAQLEALGARILNSYASVEAFALASDYRVVAVRKNAQNQDVPSANSEIAYGMPTKYDRQVKIKVDRLYGAQYWEYALSPTPPDTENVGTNWAFAWDTLELVNGTFTGFPGPMASDFTLVPGPHKVFARSFTQGIGSTKDGKAANLDDNGGGGPGPGPGCPDDDDGDGDDDDDDGDSDDDGDDDDDCEDDDDEEEDDD